MPDDLTSNLVVALALIRNREGESWVTLREAEAESLATEIERLQQRVAELEMPWAQLAKKAESDEGVDTQTFIARLWKKIEDQKREIARLQVPPNAARLQYELGFAQQLEGEQLRIDYYGRSHTMRVDHWLDAAWQWNGETRAAVTKPAESFETWRDRIRAEIAYEQTPDSSVEKGGGQ